MFVSQKTSHWCVVPPLSMTSPLQKPGWPVSPHLSLRNPLHQQVISRGLVLRLLKLSSISFLLHIFWKAAMLVWGVSNPEGVDNESSVYLTKSDIKDMIEQVESANNRGEPIPVKIEHKGVALGRVVSAWEHNGELQCILKIDENVFEGSIGSEFIKQGITKDLSLGYEVSFQNSKNKSITVKKKWLKEISIVKKGARRNCHIMGVKY